MRLATLIFGLSLALLFIVCTPIYAAETTTKFVPLTGADVSKIELAPFMTNAFKESASMADFVNAAFLAAIGIGAMLAVLQLARAGFLYMGSDVWHKKEQARHLIQDAIIGLLLLLSVWIVLGQINPQLRNLDVLDGIKVIKSSEASRPQNQPLSIPNMKIDLSQPDPTQQGSGIDPYNFTN